MLRISWPLRQSIGLNRNQLGAHGLAPSNELLAPTNVALHHALLSRFATPSGHLVARAKKRIDPKFGIGSASRAVLGVGGSVRPPTADTLSRRCLHDRNHQFAPRRCRAWSNQAR